MGGTWKLDDAIRRLGHESRRVYGRLSILYDISFVSLLFSLPFSLYVLRIMCFDLSPSLPLFFFFFFLFLLLLLLLSWVGWSVLCCCPCIVRLSFSFVGRFWVLCRLRDESVGLVVRMLVSCVPLSSFLFLRVCRSPLNPRSRRMIKRRWMIVRVRGWIVCFHRGAGGRLPISIDSKYAASMDSIRVRVPIVSPLRCVRCARVVRCVDRSRFAIETECRNSAYRSRMLFRCVQGMRAEEEVEFVENPGLYSNHEHRLRRRIRTRRVPWACDGR